MTAKQVRLGENLMSCAKIEELKHSLLNARAARETAYKSLYNQLVVIAKLVAPGSGVNPSIYRQVDASSIVKQGHEFAEISILGGTPDEPLIRAMREYYRLNEDYKAKVDAVKRIKQELREALLKEIYGTSGNISGCQIGGRIEINPEKFPGRS
jgi:hypothetical protein